MTSSNRHNRRVQPLKPKRQGIVGKTVLLLLLVALAGLLLRNFENISGYVNKPITGLALQSTLIEVSKDDLNVLLGEFVGQGFFSLDVKAAQEKLRGHPWIADAEVNRIWPNQIAVGIVEEVAIARWGEHGLINQYGKMFTPAQRGSRGNLPLLIGPDSSQVLVMDQYQRLNQLMSEKGLRIAELELSSRGSWQMLLSDGIRVIIGREEVITRVARLANFYHRLPLTSPATEALLNEVENMTTLDLRYDNGIAIKSNETELTGVAAR